MVTPHPRLSLKQETFLKKQLLKTSIQAEVEQVFTNTKKVEDTIFMKFMYDELLDFPLWGTRPDARAKCNELLMTLPKLLIHSQKATKRDTKNKATRQVITKCFDMSLRTNQQKEDDKQQQELDISSRLGDVDKVISSGAQLSAAGQAILGKYDYAAIFRIVQESETITALPAQFQYFIKKLIHTLAIWIDAELQDANMVKKLKTIQLLTPTLAIRAILAISNPVKLLQNVVSLLLARPFGSWNLMQKLFAVMVDTSKTERLLKSTHKSLDACLATQGVSSVHRKKIITKLKHYARENGTPNSNGDTLCDRKPGVAFARILNIAAPLLEGYQQPLSIVTMAAMYDYFMLVGRLKEKVDFIELLGNEQMLDIMRELLPVIYTPMAQLFSRARVGTHFHILFKTLKRIIKASESSSLTGPRRYVPVLERFVSELYSFLHESAVHDDHSIDDALRWLVQLLAFAKEETIDLDALLVLLDENTFSLLVKEVDQVVAFYEYRAKLKEWDAANNSDDEEDDMAAGAKDSTKGNPGAQSNSISDPKFKNTPTLANTGNKESPQSDSSTTRLPAEVPRPDLVYIPLLVEGFISMVKSQFDHLELTSAHVPTTTVTPSATSTSITAPTHTTTYTPTTPSSTTPSTSTTTSSSTTTTPTASSKTTSHSAHTLDTPHAKRDMVDTCSAGMPRT